MLARRDLGGDLGEVQAHRLGVTVRQHECRALALLGTDSSEDVGRRGALIVWCTGPAATRGPAAGDLVLLTYPGLISEPDFDISEGDVFLSGDFFQAGGETFLKSSTAPSACA